MKKFLVASIVALLFLAGCSSDNGNTQESSVYKVGTASVTSVSPRDYNSETDQAGRVQVNTTFANVVLDEEGVFVYVAIDVAQNEGTFDSEGVVVTAEAAPTKKEKGDAYNMKGASAIGKEWDEQIAAFEEWVIGKTLEDVKALAIDGGYLADSEDLKSSVTVRVTDYIAVVEKAVEYAETVEDVARVGVASVTSVSGRDFVEGTDGRIQVNVTFAGVAYDGDGNILYVSIDTAQNQGTFDGEGVVVAADAVGTKKERGNAYGMANASPIGKEWDEQITSFELFAVGKTLSDVTGLAIDGGYLDDAEDLKSEVTMRVTDYIAALEKATDNAVSLN